MGDGKWTPKKGDIVWAARFGYGDEVETGSVAVKSATDKQITLAKMKAVFGYSTRLGPSCAGTRIHPTEVDALTCLAQFWEREAEGARRRAALVRAALAKARGES